MPHSPDLHDMFADLDQMRGAERRVALATLVATVGTTPKKEGAKMWIGAGGRMLGSVTIGGCVDAQVVQAADDVLASGRTALLAMSLSDEQGWDLGLTCGGTLRVLVEPVQLDVATDPVSAAYDLVRRSAAGGARAVVVARLSGSPARLVVVESGAVAGTLGDRALDAAAGEEARSLFRSGASGTRTVAGTELFFEVHGPAPHLIVFGATHVAMPLVEAAAVLGWPVTVIDARERFATRERFPRARAVLVGEVGALAAGQHYDAGTHVVIVTHDYKFELPILREVLAREPAYVGLLASRKRAQALRAFLAEDGVDPAALDRVHVPIGLRIGAQTAAEIALSILGEIIAVRAERRHSPAASGPTNTATSTVTSTATSTSASTSASTGTDTPTSGGAIAASGVPAPDA